MKFKLFNLLTVCLATSGLLAPAQAAFGHSVERQMNVEEAQHLVCVKEAQHLVCEVETSRERDSLRDSFASRESARNQGALKSSTVNAVPQLLSSAQQGSIANILICLTYLVPCGLGLGIFLYDKYCVYRAAVLHEQIEMLEKLWKQSTQH